MDFPTILLLGTFVIIIAVAMPMLSYKGPASLEESEPENTNGFASRLRESRARKAAGAAALAAAGAGAVNSKVDLRKKKNEGSLDISRSTPSASCRR